MTTKRGVDWADREPTREEFIRELTRAYSKLTGISVAALHDFIVTAMGGERHDRWWLAAKSAILTAPPFALQFIAESHGPAKDSEQNEMFNWSSAEIREFYRWAQQLPGWDDNDAPVTYVEVWRQKVQTLLL